MNATTLLALAALYFLLTQPRSTTAPAAPAAGAGAGYYSGPGGTRISLPGIGSYVSAGGVTQVQLDPSVFSWLRGSGGQPGGGATIQQADYAAPLVVDPEPSYVPYDPGAVVYAPDPCAADPLYCGGYYAAGDFYAV